MNQIDIESTDLNLLKVFEAIYDEGGAGRAALRLGVTQSAVSAALARLRVLYADPLFVRTGRGLSPSLRARELRPIIGEALDKCRQSLSLARPGAAGFGGRSVTLGLSDDFEIALGREAIAALAVAAPGLRLIFRQTHSRVAADMLMAREVDLVIASGGLTAPALQRVTVGQGAMPAWWIRPAWRRARMRCRWRTSPGVRTCWCRRAASSAWSMKCCMAWA